MEPHHHKSYHHQHQAANNHWDQQQFQRNHPQQQSMWKQQQHSMAPHQNGAWQPPAADGLFRDRPIAAVGGGANGDQLFAACLFCREPAELACARCAAPYCSGRCQQVDWSHHSRDCTVMPVLVPRNHFQSAVSMAKTLSAAPAAASAQNGHDHNKSHNNHEQPSASATGDGTGIADPWATSSPRASRSREQQPHKPTMTVAAKVATKVPPKVEAATKPASTTTVAAAAEPAPVAAAAARVDNPFRKAPVRECSPFTATDRRRSSVGPATRMTSRSSSVCSYPPKPAAAVNKPQTNAASATATAKPAAPKAAEPPEPPTKPVSVATTLPKSEAESKKPTTTAAAAATDPMPLPRYMQKLITAVTTSGNAPTATAVTVTGDAAAKPNDAQDSKANSVEAGKITAQEAATTALKPATEVTMGEEFVRMVDLLFPKPATEVAQSAAKKPAEVDDDWPAAAKSIDPPKKPIAVDRAAAAHSTNTRYSSMRCEPITVPYCDMPASGSLVEIADVINPRCCFIYASDSGWRSNRKAIDLYANEGEPAALSEPVVVDQVVLAVHPSLKRPRRAQVKRIGKLPADGNVLHVELTVAFLDQGAMALVRLGDCWRLPAELQLLRRYVHPVTVHKVSENVNRKCPYVLTYEPPFGKGTVAELAELTDLVDLYN